MDSQAARIARDWKLTILTPLAKTATCEVFQVSYEGGLAAFKVFTELGRRDEAAGAIALEYFGARGAVKLLHASKEAQLLEYVDGPLLLDQPDEAATKILCAILKKLHTNQKPLPRGLVPLEQRFRSLLGQKGGDKLSKDGAAVARELLQKVENEKVLHGDFHHENVLQCSDRGWLAIDPKGLRGEAAFDAAVMVFNPNRNRAQVEDPKRIERQIAQISEYLSLNPARFRRWAFAYGALSVRWSEEDNTDGSLARAVAEELQKKL